MYAFYESENFLKLGLLQIVSKLFLSSPEFSSQRSSQKYRFYAYVKTFLHLISMNLWNLTIIVW